MLQLQENPWQITNSTNTKRAHHRWTMTLYNMMDEIRGIYHCGPGYRMSRHRTNARGDAKIGAKLDRLSCQVRHQVN